MGTLLGHLLPGALFFVFGLWCCYSTLRRYYLYRREALFTGRGVRQSVRYRSTLLFPCISGNCCWRNRPIDSVLFLIASAVGFFGELVMHTTGGNTLTAVNGQHMTMYFFFSLLGVTNILLHYRFALPPDLDYLSTLLALAIEGFLFIHHLHGRSTMDYQLHMFLVYLIVVCGAATAWEMVHKTNVLPAICRAFGLTLQGTWFIQVGLILYPPPFLASWDEENHDQMMVVTMIFTWHFAGVFVLFSLVGSLIHVRIKFMSRMSVYESLNMKIIDKPHDIKVSGEGFLNGHLDGEMSRILGMSDSEEDIL